MRPADTWKDYELLDATDGNRLERWGETILIRPDPQVVWKTPKQSPLWAKADAGLLCAGSSNVCGVALRSDRSGLHGRDHL